MSVLIILFRVYRYVHYWLYKMDEHSLHSPFVFSLYKNSLKSYSNEIPIITSAESIRKKLRNDHREIDLATLGSQSQIRNNQKISSISRLGISNLKTSKMLSSLIQHIGAKSVLELGTSVGINTIYLAKAGGVEEVVSIEGNKSLVEIASECFDDFGLDNIDLQNKDVDVCLDELLDRKREFDFVFMDANHTEVATKRYFEKVSQIVSKNSIIVLDDINWSPGMNRAWQEIKESSKEQLIVENYQFGMVFSGKIPASGSYILDF
ncbi:MAG: class I SAM-dependent methyltransferase [Reichenbachiella sp.]